MGTRLRLGLVLVALTGWPAVAGAQGQSATVLSIGDGDTIRVRQAGKAITVRLACIDAPELAQSPWGQQARAQLQTMAPVQSAVMLHRKATDRYGRSVAEVSQRGRSINQALVARGGAFVYWAYISGCDRQRYSRLESEARLKRLGVWSTPGGITRPWDFRRRRRSASVPDDATPGGRGYRWSEIGSYVRAQQLLGHGHIDLDGDGDGKACESLR